MDGSSLVAPATIALSGGAIGVALGFVGHRSSFCTMGALADIVTMGSWVRMRMWILAIGVAIVGTAALQTLGGFDVTKTLYAGSNLPWLSHLVGGLAFGVGMTLAGGCGNKTLIRLGAGSLKSVVVFAFVAISAYMTMKGLFGVWRVRWLDPWALSLGRAQDLPTLLAGTFGLDRRGWLLLLALLLGGGCIAFALRARELRRFEPLLGGAVTGLLVVVAWYVTGRLGYVAEHPETLQEAFIGTNSGRAESLSFVAPYAYALELLMLWSDATRILTFGIATAIGVGLGAAASALSSGGFRLEGFRQTDDLARHIIGSILMGFGGVTALGCSIGQGITGLSTLSLGSMLTTAAIVVGCVATVKWEYARAMAD